MKKIILVLVLFTLLTAGVFALDVAMGGGAVVDLSFNNGVKYSNSIGKYYHGFRNYCFSGNFFVDFTYAEVDVSIGYGKLKYINESPTDNNVVDEGDGSIQINFGLILKYPIVFGRAVFFPFAGISYNVFLSAWDDNYNYDDYAGIETKDFNQFGLLAGVGIDSYFNDYMYFRIEAALDVRFASQYQKDYVGRDTTVGLGPRIKLAIGKHL